MVPLYVSCDLTKVITRSNKRVDGNKDDGATC